MLRKGIGALAAITLGWIILAGGDDNSNIILSSNIILESQPSIILSSNIILENQPTIILADAPTDQNPDGWLIL